MRCINKGQVVLLGILASIFITGCGNKLDIPYDINTNISAYSVSSVSGGKRVTPFANNLCVVDSDINSGMADLSLAESGVLFNRVKHDTIYAKSANLQLHPASTTKIMTALLALKYGKLNDILTASSNVEIKESGAQLCGFKEGDRATLDQVLHGLLLYSGNDAGVMIAEYVSGSEEAFAKLMNEEAKAIGATNTNFVNPHGLTDDAHLTTAYDLYLIFNEALKYDKFKELLETKSYSSTYTAKDGSVKKLEFDSTNRYINGKVSTPSGVTVLGGKTGTTKAAGSCLVLYSKNSEGDDFISVVMKSESADSLYENMNSLLSLE